MKKLVVLLALSAITCSGFAQKDNYFVKKVEFPQGATLMEKVDLAARLVPTPQQLAWQQMELTAFLHFGINTFTGREWGDGTEDPALFNPSELNAEQWVSNLKEAGFKMVLLTAKHHDGFCLWPTRTTKHSVASSPWKNGKGDVVGDLRKACDKYDMRFGVYLSPWDRNASCYGDSPKYNAFFIEQLTELLSNYGEIDEVWFDGANGEGPNGKKQVYDWDTTLATIHRLQPQAVTAIWGDDVRWVGNERGLGRETEWSATVLTPEAHPNGIARNAALGILSTAKDLGSREMIARTDKLFWYPSEVDVSIRPGWFYHAEEDSKVKSLKQLADIYFQSVGYNSVLLLNIPPDRRGLINEADVNRLKEFAAYRQQVFADNRVLKGAKAWQAAPAEARTYALKKDSEINLVVLQEDIAKGQRVEAFELEALTADGWKQVAKGTTIGYKRMVRFDAVKASQLRLRLTACRANAHISQVAAYRAAALNDVAGKEAWRTDGARKLWKLMDAAPLTLDLGKVSTLKAFVYAPAGEVAKPTTAFRYKIYSSLDGKTWTSIPANGEFSNIMNNPLPQTVTFGKAVKARYFKLEATTATDVQAVVSMNELGLITF
ncbi:MAG: alpha-L-fucosidase [Bacteroides sp.]